MSNLDRPQVPDAPTLPSRKKGESLDLHVDNISLSVRQHLQRLAVGQNVGIGISPATILPPASASMRGRLVVLLRGSGGNPDELWFFRNDGAGSPERQQITIP